MNTWINSTAETEREAEQGRNEGKLARRKVKKLHVSDERVQHAAMQNPREVSLSQNTDAKK